MSSETLAAQTCSACQVGAPVVTDQECQELLSSLPGWQRADGSVPKLYRQYLFPNYAEALAFVQSVGELAEAEGHHPKIVLEWGKVDVTWWTHKINNLHRNDFICAAKTDALLA